MEWYLKITTCKTQIHHMVKHNVVIGVLRDTESKYGLCFRLTPFPHRLSVIFRSSLWFSPIFRKMPGFWVKLGSQIFQNIRPWLQTFSEIIILAKLKNIVIPPAYNYTHLSPPIQKLLILWTILKFTYFKLNIGALIYFFLSLISLKSNFYCYVPIC